MRPTIIMTAIIVLAGCATEPPPDPNEIPQAVVAMAGPGQDLSTARLLPQDNCYWYQHQSPVETTLIPLRTSDGRPICAS